MSSLPRILAVALILAAAACTTKKAPEKTEPAPETAAPAVQPLTAEAKASMGMFKEGNDLLLQKKSKEAVVAFERCLQTHPGHCLCQRALANTHAGLGEKQKAVEGYERYLKICKHPPDEDLVKEQIRALQE